MTEDENNKENIQNFVSGKKGKALERYLKECAWADDTEGNTKVYLVKDKQTNNIVFYFALSAGLLYRRLEDRNLDLTDKENEIVDSCVSTLKYSDSISVDEALSLYVSSDDDKEYDKLRSIIVSEYDRKMDADDDKKKTDEGININRVSETYPSIILTHFCKNISENDLETEGFPIGFYIFWEIIVEKVLEISKVVGCMYLYLFAADRSENMGTIHSLADFIYDIDEEEDQGTTHDLVDYYINDLKFEKIRSLNVIKPQYDFLCFSLFQEINKLEKNRELAWNEHSDIDE